MTSSITRAVYLGQPAGSRISTSTLSSAPWETSCSLPPGFLNSPPHKAATSRATPTMERQSGLLGVRSKSRIQSSNSSADESGCPTSSSGSRIMIPSSSSPMSSSLSEQIIPTESTPLRLLLEIRTPPGSSAPIRATGTLAFSLTLGAPHTI